MTPLRFMPYSRNMPSKLSSKDEERDKAKEGLFEASEKKSVKGVFKHVSRGGWEKKKKPCLTTLEQSGSKSIWNKPGDGY